MLVVSANVISLILKVDNSTSFIRKYIHQTVTVFAQYQQHDMGNSAGKLKELIQDPTTTDHFNATFKAYDKGNLIANRFVVCVVVASAFFVLLFGEMGVDFAIQIRRWVWCSGCQRTASNL